MFDFITWQFFLNKIVIDALLRDQLYISRAILEMNDPNGVTTFNELQEKFPSLQENLSRICQNSVKHTNVLLGWYPAAKRANPGYAMVISNLVHIFLWAGDLSAILLAGMNSSTSGNILGRVIAVHLYDSSMSLVPDMLGKEFRRAFAELPAASEKAKEFNQIHNKLMAFKNSNRSFLQRVRNVSFAHRDKSIETLVAEINGFPEEKVIPLAIEYLTHLGGLMTLLGDQLADPRNLSFLGANQEGGENAKRP